MFEIYNFDKSAAFKKLMKRKLFSANSLELNFWYKVNLWLLRFWLNFDCDDVSFFEVVDMTICSNCNCFNMICGARCTISLERGYISYYSVTKVVQNHSR
jgi:hypothetical protein